MRRVTFQFKRALDILRFDIFQKYHIVVILIFIVFAKASSLLAENISILGIPFKVDALSEIDSKSVQVEVFGESLIVLRDNLEDSVVNIYFNNLVPTRGIESSWIKKFILKAVESGKQSYIVQAMVVLLRVSGSREEEVFNLIDEISSASFGSKVLEEVLLTLIRDNNEELTNSIDPHFIIQLLLKIGLKDLTWLRTRAIGWVYRHEELFKEYAGKEFRRAVELEDYEIIDQIPHMLLALFGHEDKIFEQLQIVRLRIKEVKEHLAIQDIEGLYPLVEVCKQEKYLGDLVYPLVAKALHDEAEKSIKSSQASKALLLLARTDFSRRTPRTHALVKLALENELDRFEMVVRDSQTEVFLRNLSMHDEEVKKLYRAKLEGCLDSLIRDHNAPEVEFLFQKLLFLRTDPDKRNDKIRIEQALIFLNVGMRSLALQKLSEVKTGISFFNRLRLGISGLYINHYVALFLFVGVLLLIAWYLYYILGKLREARIEEEKNAFQTFHEGFQGFKMRNSLPRVEVSTMLEEYKRQLSILGLNPDANLKEIKSIYRSQVKRVHPDLRKKQDPKASQEFVEITQAYERVLELRKELGVKEE